MADIENLKPWFRVRLLAMLDELGWGRDALVSAYRSSQNQARLYRCWIVYRDTGRCLCPADGCNPANPPGTSRHEYGEATDWAQWAIKKAQKLAPKYGFCFPYANDKRERHHMESLPAYYGNDMGYGDEYNWVAAAVFD